MCFLRGSYSSFDNSNKTQDWVRQDIMEALKNQAWKKIM